MAEETAAFQALRDMLIKVIAAADEGCAAWRIADAILERGEPTDLTCDRKGRWSNDWPPEFERMQVSLFGPPVPVIDVPEVGRG